MKAPSLLLLALLVATAPACSTPEPGRDLDTLERYREQEDAARLLFVEARYSDGQSQPGLSIERALAVRGTPPFLVDPGNLAGRVEILDREGTVLWASGYRVPQASLDSAQRRRVLLSLPLPDGAASVRLVEERSGHNATAPIGRGDL